MPQGTNHYNEISAAITDYVTDSDSQLYECGYNFKYPENVVNSVNETA
jgi:hypothetical protein